MNSCTILLVLPISWFRVDSARTERKKGVFYSDCFSFIFVDRFLPWIHWISCQLGFISEDIFSTMGQEWQYFGGRHSMSTIGQSKLRLEELKIHLSDHVACSKWALKEATLHSKCPGLIRDGAMSSALVFYVIRYQYWKWPSMCKMQVWWTYIV